MTRRFLLFLMFFLLVFVIGGNVYYFYLKRKLSSPQNSRIVLVNQNPRYLMKLNSSFKSSELNELFNKYGKEKLTFYLVDNENAVPWDGETQRGRERDGKANKDLDLMMAIYSGKEISYYFFPYPYLETKGSETLSRVISYKILEALSSQNRDYLFGRTPSPKIPTSEIERYTKDKPLVMVELNK